MQTRHRDRLPVALFAAAILALSLSGCGGGGGSAGPSPASRGVTVSGAVLDATTGAPIAGASVTVGARSALTDSSGTYTVSDVAIGSQELQVSAAGYEDFPSSGSPPLIVNVVEEATTLDDILLVPAGQLPPPLP